MQTVPPSTVPPYTGAHYAEVGRTDPAFGALTPEVGPSAVSWGAILVGAFAAAALSLILLVLGTGLGFSSVSPWANDGASAKAIGIATVIWIILMAAIASGMGRGAQSGRQALAMAVRVLVDRRVLRQLRRHHRRQTTRSRRCDVVRSTRAPTCPISTATGELRCAQFCCCSWVYPFRSSS